MIRRLLIPLLLLFAMDASAQRIRVDEAKFKVDGKEIWLNGANVPWQHWNDFGGDFDPTFWNAEFGRIRQAGGNTVRIWITCNGETGVRITADGRVDGMTEAFWEDTDVLMDLARKNRIYVMATLISFDHSKDSHPGYQAWRKMYLSDANIASFVSNYAVPFAKRYASNDFLFAIEPCNEIEWVHEVDRLPWERLQLFCARVAAGVHAASPVLVTVGCSVKWQSDKAEGNLFSDAKLRAAFDDPGAYLDFYSPHWYDWVTKWFGSPFSDRDDVSYGLETKPAIIGECPANGDWVIYEDAYKNGWEGVLAWTSNSVDANGGLNGRLRGQMEGFAKKHPGLVDPAGKTKAPGRKK